MGKTQDNPLFIKCFVKQNAVLLRWAPSNKDIFDLGAKNGYKITRTEINSTGAPIILAENIKPVSSQDSSTWLKLIHLNKNAILSYQVLYENSNSKQIPEKVKGDQLQMAYGMMLLNCNFNADVAKASGLYFKDTTAKEKRSYIYKIEINSAPDSRLQSVSSEINTGILSENPAITLLEGSFKNRIAKLKWNTADYKESYAAYDIERSLDNVSYVKINSAPIILLTSELEKKKNFITYIDTIPQPKVKFYYRIKGINHFGEQSEPSNVISGIGYEPLKSYPLIDSSKVVENRKVKLRWRMQDPTENNIPMEYVLFRSEKDAGPYTIIFHGTSLAFTDELPKYSNYYKVAAVSAGNDTLLSYPVLALMADTIPPNPPIGLKAKANQNGSVEITWEKHPEKGLKGYKIYKSNGLNEEFVQVSKEFIKDENYHDKLNLKTLSKKVFYSISVVDSNYNASELSKPVEVQIPDTIPPISAIIKDLQISQNGIRVTWLKSSSQDVAKYILFHSDETTKVDTKLFDWNQSDTITSFMDTLTQLGTGYHYKIITMDDADNISISNAPYMFFETGFREKIADVRTNVDRSAQTIWVTWNYQEKEVEKFIIYRAKTKQPLTIIKTVEFPISNFEDKTLSIGNTYEYRIKAVFKNGAESIISDAAIVEF